MNKNLLTTISIFTLLLFITTSVNGIVAEAHAWDDCPKGLIDEEYPGSCPRYVDTDENGTCDHSEPALEDRAVSDSSSQAEGKTSEPGMDSPNLVALINKTLSTGAIAFLSIFIPLVVLVAYAWVYKFNQNTKLI